MKAMLRGPIATACALAACALSALPAVAHASDARAAAVHDTQPPALSTPIKARFVVGSLISQFRDTQDGNAFFDVPMRLTWSATDNTDSELNYDVWEYPQGAEPNRIGNFITETTFDVLASDYDGFFGGAPNVIDRWGVQAYDDVGNSTARTVFGAHLFVRQDDPTLHTIGTEAPVKVKGLRYTGTWAVANCACYADKTTHRTNAKNAAVAMNVTVAKGQQLSRVALVMDQGPGHGRARILIDGKASGTVDTLAANAIHRGVVWTASLRPGAHTIRIVNLATQGRARIDFDAVMVN